MRSAPLQFSKLLRPWESAIISCIIFSALALWLLPEVAQLKMPLGGDNGIHFARGIEFYHQLSTGHLWNWSWNWMLGYPPRYNYPMGGDLFIALIRGILFWNISDERVYGIAVLLVHIFNFASIYRLGTVTISRLCGFLAAIIVGLHVGDFATGGWIWTVQFGVWPVLLAVSFTQFALAELLDESNKSDDRWAIRFALLAGLGLISHPIIGIFWMISVPTIVAWHLIVSSKKIAGKIAMSGVVALGIASIWWLPYLSAVKYSALDGLRWFKMSEIISLVFKGKLMGGFPAFFQWFGLLAVCVLCLNTTRRRALKLMALIAVVTIFVCSNECLDFLKLILSPIGLASRIENIQWNRLAMLLKPLLTIASLNFCLASIGTLSFALNRFRPFGRLVPAMRFFAVALFIGIAMRTFTPYQTRILYGTLETDRAELIQWYKGQNLADDHRFFRFAISDDVPHASFTQSHLLNALSHDFNRPVTSLGSTLPAIQFVEQPTSVKSQWEETAKYLNVRYILSLKNEDFAGFTKTGHAGRFSIWEAKSWDSSIFHSDDRLTEFTSQEISENHFSIKISNNSSALLYAKVAAFDRWHVHWNGHEIASTPTIQPLSLSVPLIAFANHGPGLYEVKFISGRPELIGATLSGSLFLSACVALIYFNFRRRKLTVTPHFEQPPEPFAATLSASPYRSAQQLFHELLAGEVQKICRFFDVFHLYTQTGIDKPSLHQTLRSFPNFREEPPISERAEASPLPRRLFILDGVCNYSLDIQSLLSNLAEKAKDDDRILCILYSPYLRWVYSSLKFFGFRTLPTPKTFLTHDSVDSILALVDLEIVRIRYIGFWPWRSSLVGTTLNRITAGIPGIRRFGAASMVLLRRRNINRGNPLLSIIVPARNERGNIAAIIDRVSALNPKMNRELIIVEGGSSDQTWEEIERCVQAHNSPMKISYFKQQNTGKNDAVKEGIAHSSGELLTILDADLTMPAEALPRFYEAYRSGKADLVNGNRLVYPMETDAMRFLNQLGNVFFAKVLSYLSGTRMGDTLCGTKLMSRQSYDLIGKWRSDFGDHDPFGDFDLLLGANEIGLKIIDLPIVYESRRYGTTNILRFRHGLMLLRMCVIAFCKLTMGARPFRPTETKPL